MASTVRFPAARHPNRTHNAREAMQMTTRPIDTPAPDEVITQARQELRARNKKDQQSSRRFAWLLAAAFGLCSAVMGGFAYLFDEHQPKHEALGKLISFNFRLMDRFVAVARGQAKAAYFFCAASASAALLVLLAGTTTLIAAATTRSTSSCRDNC